MAAAVSLLVPGLGHVYLGRWGRAAIWFLGGLLILGIVSGEGIQTWVLLVTFLPLNVIAAVDAAVMAAAEGGTRRRE